jgi:ferredoxin
MPKVHFLNEVVTIEDAPEGITIYELAQKADIQLFKGFWTSYNCHGKGRCMGAGCRVWVNELEPNAVPKKRRKLLALFGRKLGGTQRMACEAVVQGDCEVRTQPGAQQVDENMQWEPDPRHYAWHDRLLVEKKKKKPKPKPAPKPAAEAAPTPAAEPAPAPVPAPAPAAGPPAEPLPEPAGKPRTRTEPRDTDSGWDE